MLKLALAAAALLLPIPDDSPIAVNVGGRATEDMRFGWPGVYFEGRFTGTDVIVEVEAGTDHLRLLVDGADRATLTKPGKARLHIQGLAAGAHVVRLEKITESQSGASRFGGFFTRTGHSLPAPRRPRQIEYIGDSYTVGYGNTSPTRDCNSAQVHDTTDTSQSFAVLAAKRLDADYRILAYSGFGIVRNYAGNRPGENLPALYPRILPGEAAVMPADPAWRPQVIVINLGTNDFSTPLKRGEEWDNIYELQADYISAFAEFVERLKRAQPQAKLVLMASDNFVANVDAVARSVGATVVRFGGLELTGCNAHPSLADHRTMAGQVESAVRPLF